MKNTYITLAAIGATLLPGAAKAQTVSAFDTLLTTPETYWNGEDSTRIGGFADGNAFFPSSYNAQFNFWAQGFALSNKTDTALGETASGFVKMYNAITPGGADSTTTYTIAQEGAVIRLTGAAAGKQPEGVYVTNSNYAYLSMKWGDGFARQFTDSDYFKLEITGHKAGVNTDTTVIVSLADGTNLLNTWLWVDLKPLGDVDSITFHLESTDNGQFGMNTPGFFCIDQFTTRDIGTGIHNIAAQLKGITVYPNPTNGYVMVETASDVTVSLFDITGKKCAGQVLQMGANSVNIDSFQPGIYFMQFENSGITETRKLMVR